MIRKEWLQILGEFVVGGICAIIGALIGGSAGFLIYGMYPQVFAERGGFEGFIGPISSLIGIALGSFLGVWWFGSRKNKTACPKVTALFTGVGLLLSLILFNFSNSYIAPLYTTYSVLYNLSALFGWLLPLSAAVIGFNISKK